MPVVNIHPNQASNECYEINVMTPGCVLKLGSSKLHVLNHCHETDFKGLMFTRKGKSTEPQRKGESRKLILYEMFVVKICCVQEYVSYVFSFCVRYIYVFPFVC